MVAKRKEAAKAEPAVVEKPKKLWKKVGGGSLRFAGRIIKPNERFYAHEEDIPKAFRDAIIEIDEKGKILEGIVTISSKKEATPVPVPKVKYMLEETPEGWFVLSPAKKRINETPLTEEAAGKLLGTLTKD